MAEKMSEEVMDPRSFYIGRFIGAVAAWCEAARAEAKDMSLSSPFQPTDHDSLITYVDKVTKENGVKFYLEKSLMTTDLFADVDMTGKWVFMIYKKDQVMEEYLALKAEKERLEGEGKYHGQRRINIAMKMGRLLGYSDSYIRQRVEEQNPSVSKGAEQSIISGKNLGLDHVHIIVKDLEEAISFHKLLGLKLVRYTEHGGRSCMMQVPSSPIIFELQQANNIENPGLNHMAFSVVDLDVFCKELRDEGMSVDGPVTSKATGRRLATLRDPHGLLWQMVQK